MDGAMDELIKRIVQALVDNPDQVSVKKIQGERTIVYELSAAKTDIGKIIGKSGRNIDSIRTILSGVSAKKKKRSILELVEENLPAASPMHSDEPIPEKSRVETGKRNGVVRWFNEGKGYGFITMDSGEDIFVHYKAMEDPEQHLVQGDRVRFAVSRGEKGLKAINVTKTGP